MAHSPVGVGTSVAIAEAAANSQPFSVQSNVIRVVAVGGDALVAVGNTPSADLQSYYVPSGGTASLALTKASNRITGITTGTTTAVDFAEGTQCPFGTGEYVTLEGVTPTTYNFEYKRIISINTKGIPGGYAQSRMVIDVDTSAGFADITDIKDARAIASNVLSVRGATASGGILYAQQVQISGDA